MNKIVLIAEPIEKGIGRHIIDLYKNLKKEKDFEVIVLYGTKRISKEYKALLEKDSNLEVKNFNNKLGFNDIKSFFEIRKLLKKIKPDIVHCHGSKAGLSGRIAAKTLEIEKIIYSPHAYFFLKYDKKSIKRKIFVWAEKLLSRFFTYKTVTTSKGEDIVFESYKIDKLNKKILIEHGIEIPNVKDSDVKKIREEYDIKETDIVIGSMARFDDQKDPLGNLEIMERIIRNINNVKCIFWGNGKLFEKVKNENIKLGEKVILAGETNKPDACLKIIDIYLTASLYEGLPYTLLESLALQKAVVASNVEGNRDCVFENENGMLFEAKDYAKATENLKYIILNGKFKEMGEKSFKIYEERFSTQRMIEEYKKLYVEGRNE